MKKLNNCRTRLILVQPGEYMTRFGVKCQQGEFFGESSQILSFSVSAKPGFSSNYLDYAYVLLYLERLGRTWRDNPGTSPAGTWIMRNFPEKAMDITKAWIK